MGQARHEEKAIFTQGSTMRHVITMTTTGSVGLLSIFFVDVINLFYISLLGEQELAAAVGYASTVMFFTISVSIGFAIAITAIVAKAIGSGDEGAAKKNAGASLIYMIIVSLLVMLMTVPLLPSIMTILGARGETHKLAVEFMYIAMASYPLMCIGISLSSLLRAKGDAKRAMYVTLSAGGAALILDPLFIFGLELGIHGAAIAIMFIRIVMVLMGLYYVISVHRMLARPDPAWLKQMSRPFFSIAIPAVLTQIATPIGNAYLTAAISDYGDDAVAGWAIIGRLLPLAFAAIFSLSGAVGPILSQNLGAGLYDRVVNTLRDSLVFTLIYSLVIWLLLALGWPAISHAFNAQGDAEALIRFFCLFVAGSFLFNGALFVANAAFNNLGYPVYSTVFNWGRATIGIIPFVWIGSHWGPEGILAGWGCGGIIFGIAAVIVCFKTIRKLPQREKHDAHIDPPPSFPTGNSPFTSGRGTAG